MCYLHTGLHRHCTRSSTGRVTVKRIVDLIFFTCSARLKISAVRHDFTHLTSGLLTTQTSPVIVSLLSPTCKPSPNQNILKILTPPKSNYWCWMVCSHEWNPLSPPFVGFSYCLYIHFVLIRYLYTVLLEQLFVPSRPVQRRSNNRYSVTCLTIRLAGAQSEYSVTSE